MHEQHWRNIIRFYEQLGSPSPKDGSSSIYEPFCKGMLAIVEEIRGKLTKPVEPKIYHHILTLHLDRALRRVYVSWVEPNRYEIWLDHSQATDNQFWGHRVAVPFDEVIPTIETYLEQTRNET